MVAQEFSPDVQCLRDLASEISTTLQAYEKAEDREAQDVALRKVVKSSRRLQAAATDPRDLFSDFTFQPLANATVRIALSIGLFNVLASSDAPLSSDEIAKRTGADPVLVARVVRSLVACDVIQQDDDGGCSNTPMSKIYADKPRASWAIWLWDVMIRSSTKIGYFFTESNKKNPTDPKNAPFTFANDEQDMNLFDIVKARGLLPLLNDGMSGSSVVCAEQAVASYRFDQLTTSDEDVAIVDVGGAKGFTLQEIKRAYPGIKGKLVLQDLQSVLDDAGVKDEKIQTQAYDFFSEEQPIKGAAAYYYQRILHDWNDENCGKILDSLRPAMSLTSKLLISDVVVPDHQPSQRKVLRDINMLLVGGKERSESEWHKLLNRHGFVIERFIGLNNADNSIIEAKLN